MAQRRLFRLERVLNDNALFSSAYGNVGSSIYYALGLVAALALGLTPLVFVIAGVIFWLTAASYTEATTMYPEAGGSSSFARHAFNETVSFGAAWVQAMNFIVTAAISALFVPHYLAFIWGPLREAPGDIIGGIVVILFLAALNIRGVRESSRLNVVMAVTDLATQFLLVLAGIFTVLNFGTLIDNVHFGLAPKWSDLFVAVPVAMIAYTGIETVSNMSEEAIDAPRTVPKAMRKVVLAVVVIYSVLPAIALSALPVEQDTPGGEYSTRLGEPEDENGFASDPVLGVVGAMGLGSFAGVAKAYVGVLAATILLLAANAGMFGVSRLLYSMGQYQHLPRAAARLHPRFRTPHIGIGVSAMLACGLVFGPAEFLGNLYAAFAMLSFTVAHLSVIMLRKLKPKAERPYVGPGNIRLRGWEVPIFAVIGGLGTAAAFVVVSALHLDVAAIGAGWLLLGFVLYAGFRRRNNLPMSETRKVEIPDQVAEDEVVYHSVLVVADPAEDPYDSLRVARRLADHPGHIRFLSLIPIMNGIPFDEPLSSEAEASKRNMKMARRVLGPRAQIREMRCRRDRKADTIIREALLARSEALVLPMPPVQRRISRDNLFGGTRLRLLDERPCRVLLVESVTTRAGFNPETVGDMVEIPLPELSAPPAPLPASRLRRSPETPRGPLMVCVFGDGLDDDVMQTACKMASPQAGGLAIVHAVAVSDVPHETPVTEAPEADQTRMLNALHRAVAVGEEYEGVDVIPHLYAAHHTALSMIKISRQLDAEVIVLAADDAAEEERAADTRNLVGSVTQTVMRFAHCRVVLTAAAHTESIVDIR